MGCFDGDLNPSSGLLARGLASPALKSNLPDFRTHHLTNGERVVHKFGLYIIIENVKDINVSDPTFLLVKKK